MSVSIIPNHLIFKLSLRFDGHSTARCNPLQRKEVKPLTEENFRKWMVVLAAGTLLATIIRLWLGI
ncbi:hypothetical protein [Roseovarius indicus]|uniref:hypothetical protein n=1 Tax=Roseovarius indicus TaxID=540747 RepID=UPI0032F083E8